MDFFYVSRLDLGIEIDSDTQVMRLSFKKIIGLQTLLLQWLHKISCEKN